MPFMNFGLFSGLANKAYGSKDSHTNDSWDAVFRVYNLIHEFTGRSLKFERDSLKAFAGVLRNLRRSKIAFYHIWGVPIVTDSLATSVTDWFVISLLYWHNGKAYRRSEFPSWSWAGWGGQVTYEKSRTLTSFRLNIFAEYHNDSNGIRSLFDIPALASPASCQGLSPSDHPYPKALHLKGFVVSPAALSFHIDPQAGIETGHGIIDIVFSGIGKDLRWFDYKALWGSSWQEKYLQEPGKDVRSRKFEMFLSDPEKAAVIGPTTFTNRRIELFILGNMDYTSDHESKLSGVVIENYTDFSCRIGTWMAAFDILPEWFGGWSYTRLEGDKIENEHFKQRHDWILERRVILN